MQFPVLNRDKKEWAFGVFKNVRGSAFARGDAVVLDSSASVDGDRVTVAAASTLALFVGISLDAPADTDYFRVQTYGYNSSVKCIGTTDVTGRAGVTFVPTAGQVYLTQATLTPTGEFVAPAVLLEALAIATTPAATTKKFFLRCL